MNTQPTDPGRPPMQAVADAAGVSIATVSRVINGKGGAGADTVGRVQEAIVSLGFRSNEQASRLARNQQSRSRSEVLGLVHFHAHHCTPADILASPMHQQVLVGVWSAARAANYTISFDFAEIGAGLPHLVGRSFLDGLIIRGDAPPDITESRQELEALGLVVVDYLQLMRPPELSRNASRENEISAISRGLKELAREVKVPFIVLSQISRKAEDRRETGKRPQLSDLRESGAIEQDADLVAMIFRESYYLPDDHPEKQEKRNVAELILAKQRNGPTGTIMLQYDDDTVTFRTLMREGE